MQRLNGPADQSMELVVVMPMSRSGYVYARRVEVGASRRTGVSFDKLLWQVIVSILREKIFRLFERAIKPECVYLFNRQLRLDELNVDIYKIYIRLVQELSLFL